MKNSAFFLLLLRGVRGILCTFGCILSANAQFQKPDISMPSPNAASLGLYGEVPVSLYTGTPNIDIPLYTLQEGKIKVPISLSYHASGVRVNQHPGWVGLNWNLNAGGAITRTVKDELDEAQYFGAQWGFYFSHNLLNDNDWDSKAFAIKMNTENYGTTSSKKEAYDTEPDEFAFNFMGYSGKFYLNHLREWQVACDRPIKVQVIGNIANPVISVPSSIYLTNNSGPMEEQSFREFVNQQPNIKTFQGFILTTEDGMKYEFGNSTDAIEYTKPFFRQGSSHWFANTWYLTKISTPQGQSVTFEYKVYEEGQGRYTAQLSPSIYYSEGGAVTNNFLNGVSPGFFDIYYSCPAQWTTSLISDDGAYTGTLTRNVYLESITGQTAKINFKKETTTELKYTYHIFQKFRDLQNSKNIFFFYWLPHIYTGADYPCQSCNDEEKFMGLIDQLKWKKLTEIEVVNLASPAVTYNKILFDYTNDNAKRLMLNGVKIADRTNSSCYNKYDFAYYHETNYDLPIYLDQKDQTDSWGFFNKHEFTLSTLNSSNVNNFVTHKEATGNINTSKEGTLKSITYPTGGYTEFDYEKHSAYKMLFIATDGSVSVVSTSMNIGGLRIKTISNYDGVNQTPKQKSYEYTYGTGSSGISSGKHEYFWSGYTVPSSNDPNYTYSRDVFSYQNLLPGGINSLGSHIGYRQVKEIENNGNNTSYTIYKFTNYESEYSSDITAHMDEGIALSKRVQSAGARYDPLIDKSFERGKLLFEEKYNSDNKLVMKKKITYKRINTGSVVRAVNATNFSVCPNIGILVFTGFPYKYYTYFFRPEKEEIYQYDQADDSRFTTDVTDYIDYNSLGMPTQIKTTRNGKSTTTFNKYVADYPTYYNNSYSTSDDVFAIWNLQYVGATGVLVEQIIANNDASDNTQRYVDGFLNIFRSYPTTATMNVQVYKTFKYVPTTLSSSFTQSTITLVSQGGLQNIFVRDAAFSKVILEFPEPVSPYSDATAAYSLLGEPMKFKGADGIWNGFTWGSGNETGLVKSKTIGYGTDLAQTTNYMYAQPLVGVSKMTDPNAQETKYEYDGFNRLKIVRDHGNNLLKSYSYTLKNSTGCPQAILGCDPNRPFNIVIINIDHTQSGTISGSNVPFSAWSDKFVTVDAGPELYNSTQSNPSIFYTENINKIAPRYWTIYADHCNLGTSGAISYDLLLAPESNPQQTQSFNTVENNAPYFMFANREGFTELYAQNHPAYGFFQDNGNGGNTYDIGFPKGLYKLGVRYWDQKGQGSIYPSTRQPVGNVLEYKEYWFRIQSQNGIGTGAARIGEKK